MRNEREKFLLWHPNMKTLGMKLTLKRGVIYCTLTWLLVHTAYSEEPQRFKLLCFLSASKHTEFWLVTGISHHMIPSPQITRQWSSCSCHCLNTTLYININPDFVLLLVWEKTVVPLDSSGIRVHWINFSSLEHV